MNTTPIGTAGAAGGAAAAIVVILVWIASLFGVTVPGEVAAALGTLIGVIIHYIATLPRKAASTADAPSVAGPAVGALLMAVLLMGGLSACTSTGQLTPGAQVAVNVLCNVDAAAVPLAQAGAQVAAVVDPALAPEVALANGADQLVHPAVIGACKAAGGIPASVTVTTTAPATAQ